MLHELSKMIPRQDRMVGSKPVQLIWYEPASLAKAQAIGAVWRDERHLHWASPLQRRYTGIFDPLPFMLRFPSAQTELAHFERALQWLDAVCFNSDDPVEVQEACAREPDWRFRCARYEGQRRGADLAALLGAVIDAPPANAEQLRAAILEAVAHLAREHPDLSEMPVEPIHDGSMEVARLHVTEGRRVRVVVHPRGGRREVIPLALLADDQLLANGLQGDRALLVLPHLRSPKPLRLSQRIDVVGLQFDVMARALIELASP